LAVSTVASAVAACAKTVEPVGVLIADHIAGAGLAHLDETGFRTAGACHWLHSACTPDAVFLTVHRKRGVEAIDAAGILPRFTGAAVHDAWAPYDTYRKAVHLLCSAHILRELIAVTETAKGRTKKMAEQAATALRELKKAADAARERGWQATSCPGRRWR
ncbi:MAG: transposase, partial [Catenulispora sp.]|nr:transposase [Catenulispora sp.]